ncbi:ribonuclease Y [Pediococcus argentinicus]|uniref:ribonuclease Y n=1 Tax=Pediococcus argentinicus TaxID=480391 RepID=UPI00338FEFA8
MNIFSIILAIIAIVVGYFGGYFIHKNIVEKQNENAKVTADSIIEDARKQAETDRREALLEAKDESHKYRSEVEGELKKRRSELQKQEDRLLQREESLDRKDNFFEKRESSLERKEQKLTSEQKHIEEQQQRASSLVEERQTELERVSKLSQDDAKDLIIEETKANLADERALIIKDGIEDAEHQVNEKAKSLIAQAIQRVATDMAAETTVTVVSLPNDDMKGRIIGREGRNIRNFENVTGVDLIIDDTPEAVVLSSFDPVRREVAHIALEKLIQDGRIHPARIEEMVEKARKELDDNIRKTGEQTIFDLGIHSMNPELVKLIGTLKYRTSYGQNVLNHSVEVANLAGILAAELGEDVTVAKRAGLLHDIGKAVDHETDESHVQIGVELAKKYKESKVVINAIESHEDDNKAQYVISVLVSAADSISAARPGARSETLQSYIHRLDKLEQLSNGFEGVKKSYAIQAGREVRVIVRPNKINDLKAVTLTHNIRKAIENELEYAGKVKVTVVREVRAVDFAK